MPVVQLSADREAFLVQRLGLCVMPLVERYLAQIEDYAGHPQLVAELAPESDGFFVECSAAGGVAAEQGDNTGIGEGAGDPMAVAQLSIDSQALSQQALRLRVVAFVLEDGGEAIE